jgi:hypothetical protein
MGPLLSRGPSFRTLSLISRHNVSADLQNEEQLRVRLDYSSITPWEVDDSLVAIIREIELKLNCTVDRSGLRNLFTEAIQKSMVQRSSGRHNVEFYIYIREFLHTNTKYIDSVRPAPEVKTEDFTEKEKQILLLL